MWQLFNIGSFIIYFLSPLVAQDEVLLSGIITDSVSQEGIEYVSIMAESRDAALPIEFSHSEEDGSYRLKLRRNTEYIVSFNLFAYNKVAITISTGEENVLRKNVVLSRRSYDLDAIEINETLPPISYKEDTTIYRAEKFYSKNTRKLGNLLQNMPGITVDRDYNVYFYGQKVEEVQVEGKKFFNGDSELAVKYLPANAIENVVVLENYHPYAFLKDFADEGKLVINVELKEGKKKLVFGDVAAGYGYKNKYTALSNLFFYSENLNLYSIVGVNNTEESILSSSQLYKLSVLPEIELESEHSILNSAAYFPYELTMTRQNIKNKVAVGTMGLQSTIGKKLEVDGFFIYHGAQQEDLQESRREYLNNSQSELLENRTITSRNKLGNIFSQVDLNYPIFSSGSITNLSRFNSNDNIYNNINTSIIETSSQITNVEDTRKSQSFHNLTELYHTISDHSLGNLSFLYEYGRDHSSTYYSGDKAFLNSSLIFPFDSSYAILQDFRYKENFLDGKYLYTHNVNLRNQIKVLAGYGRQLMRFDVLDTYQSEYTDEELIEPELGGENVSDYSEFYSSLVYRLKRDVLLLKIGVDINVLRYGINGYNFKKTPAAFPVFDLEYTVINFGKFHLEYEGEKEVPDFANRLRFPFIGSFNHINLASSQLELPSRHKVRLSYSFNNAMKQIGIYCFGTYSLTDNPFSTSQDYDLINSTSYIYNESKSAHYVSSYLRFTKDYWKHHFLFSFNYQFRNNRQTLSGNKIDFKGHRISPKITYRYRLRDSLETSFSLGSNTQFNTRENQSNITQNYNFETFLTYYLFEDLELVIDYSLVYFNGNVSQVRHFLNAELIYRPKLGIFGISLKGFNLLNNKYHISSYSNEIIYSETLNYNLQRYFMLSCTLDI